MFCPKCGTPAQDAARICGQCGFHLEGNRPIPPSFEENAGVRMLIPVGRSFWAILAGYFALFSVLILPAPLALLFGILAVVDIRKNPQKHGMGRAIFGIVAGGLFTLLLVFFAVIALFENI